MTRREWIAKIINKYKLKTFAEIGVDEGWTFEYVMENTELDCYIAVERIIKYKFYDRIQRSEKIDEWGKTKKPLVVMRMNSVDAAKMITNNSLDMIFIDADHHYEAVLEDVIAWVPKVKMSGLITGHDYDPTGGFDVWKVVDKIFGKKNIKLIPDDAGGPNNQCWAYVKDEDTDEMILKAVHNA